jgi:3-oxoacyl-[acyl-carrier-protein] synthase-3
MEGLETFRVAVDRISEVTLEAAELAGTTLDGIDLFVYHQANSRILRAVGERLELDPAKVVDCIERFGNTSAASIPLALCWAEQEGMLTDGATVLFGAIGAGFTYGAFVTRWGAP